MAANDQGGGVHTRNHAGWLSGTLPKRTEGANITSAKTVDQYAADKLGAETPLRSLELTLESNFHSLWVSGEVSEISRPGSGHIYFTLKDDGAQIRGVLWRSSAQRLRFRLEEGQEVICHGDLDVYPPRGTYQLVVRQVQPLGQGALQLAFQQLQRKLAAEGLFDAAAFLREGRVVTTQERPEQLRAQYRDVMGRR